MVVPTDETASPAKQRGDRKLSPDELLALEALKRAIEAAGEILPETSAIPAGKRCMRVDAWRDRFYEGLGERDGNARRQAFFRGKRGLLARRLASCSGEWVWLW